MSYPVLAITSGEPAGIGPDICLDIPQFDLPVRCVILADINLMRERARLLDKEVHIVPYQAELAPQDKTVLEVLHMPLAEPCQTGVLNVRNAPYVITLLDRAHQGIIAGEFAGMVTAPLHKGIINDAGRPFSGHTEYLADISHTPQVVMMLAGGGLRVALVTTHLPLKDIAAHITPELLSSVVQILHHDLQHKLHIAQPRILVTGLNPHAGEQGHLGHEELDVIIPTLQNLQAAGLDVRGPYPADTVFEPFILKDSDAVLAMYHDQGLPVLKYASFGQGVNITLGLPFIRTSVDHGTALDLAGTGRAMSGSLQAAIAAALEMLPPQC
ncbi:4-hydroxythreonine-4-phosphate dehydrogenase PdxA [Vitreoscilla massiliensis]|uniref:4-hydroxythreonine-4-phosphate dehydrogenase n=1 Tax=Vitreoscilla massiliensis TaxID=1689272 RepID=A0ABY4E797_9NEIS|nr:4-hydroxythreonine-4-phosphate dehydrogenase PdxA [Vitreoscilla massiliensis]UOO91213.1 4-hydroxythreonine-4-phosphate dehydrogenase PdxA [Vitreoscilla massiliensis]